MKDERCELPCLTAHRHNERRRADLQNYKQFPGPLEDHLRVAISHESAYFWEQPASLFKHLLARHVRLSCTCSGASSSWPLFSCRLPKDFNAQDIRRLQDQSEARSLLSMGTPAYEQSPDAQHRGKARGALFILDVDRLGKDHRILQCKGRTYSLLQEVLIINDYVALAAIASLMLTNHKSTLAK